MRIRSFSASLMIVCAMLTGCSETSEQQAEEKNRMTYREAVNRANGVENQYIDFRKHDRYVNDSGNIIHDIVLADGTRCVTSHSGITCNFNNTSK